MLSRGDTSIACEVTVTTTIDHEIGNVVKCLKAGFTRVALVSVSEDKLAKLSAAVANSLGEEKAKCVTCHLPDAFIASLCEYPSQSAVPKEAPRTRGGRTVKRTFTPVSPVEEKAKEAEALRLMAELMKRREKRG